MARERVHSPARRRPRRSKGSGSWRRRVGGVAAIWRAWRAIRTAEPRTHYANESWLDGFGDEFEALGETEIGRALRRRIAARASAIVAMLAVFHAGHRLARARREHSAQ